MNSYLYYFENDNPIIHVRYLSGLIALINEQTGAAGDGQSALTPAVEAHYKNTVGKCVLFMVVVRRRMIAIVRESEIPPAFFSSLARFFTF